MCTKAGQVLQRLHYGVEKNCSFRDGRYAKDDSLLCEATRTGTALWSAFGFHRSAQR
jgi:hypothetical protein